MHSLAVQADGKILVGGRFTTLGGQPRDCIGRLNADGTLDSSFNPGAGGEVFSLAVQADGKILVGGSFTTLGGQTRSAIGRLNADGTLDSGFNPGAGGNSVYSPWVYSLAVQADGKILVGGFFTTLGGQSRTNIGRLNNTAPATQSLSFDGSTITWLRGGASPEVWRTTFDYSTNGTDWTSLGAGTRTAGGWQLTSVSLPSASCTIRARGCVTGGAYNASSWFVETTAGPPAISFQPYSLVLNAGTTASFSVEAGGSGPLGYQWRKDGVPLADGGNIAGAATAMLVLTNVLGGDAGGYSVVVSNGLGSVTSAVATLVVIDPLIAVQPVSQLGKLGDSVTFSVTAVGTAPLGYQWWKDGGALAWGTGASLTLTNLEVADAGDYWVVVSNQYGNVTSAVALLTVNGATLDSGFNPGAGGNSVYSPWVYSLAVQADGKILVGGYFATLGGQGRTNIGRLNADGTLDTSFNPGADNTVSSLAVQADGKILVGGYFTNLCGQPRTFLGRLNSDGTLDTGFNPGANNTVGSLAVQADGKILVGGGFQALGGQWRNCIGRLNADGTLDSGFNPGAGGNSPYVDSLAVQADGKILVGGDFTTLGGQTRNYLGRLNADGTLDSGFNPGAGGNSPYVDSLALQADGKILVGGGFTTLGGQTRNYIGRLNADGTLDTGFNPGVEQNPGYGVVVSSLAVQADGKILVGGEFTALGGQPRNYLGRLNSDGTLDTGFNPGVEQQGPGLEPSVSSLAVQADGKILVGGWFTTLAGQPRNYLGRLNNTEPATQSLSLDGSTITWLRGGASPEVRGTTFDLSANGTEWASLGAGARIAGGWQLTSVSLPSANGALRARGYLDTWFVETDLVPTSGPPVFISAPASRTNDPGTTATFSVVAGGPGPWATNGARTGCRWPTGGTLRGRRRRCCC